MDDVITLMEKNRKQALTNLEFLKELNKRQRLVNKVLYVALIVGIINVVMIYSNLFR